MRVDTFQEVLEAVGERADFTYDGLEGTSSPYAFTPYMRRMLDAFGSEDYEQYLIDARLSYVIYDCGVPLVVILDKNTPVFITGSRPNDDCDLKRLQDYLLGTYKVRWSRGGRSFTAKYRTEAARDARIVELVKSGAESVQILV